MQESEKQEVKSEPPARQSKKKRDEVENEEDEEDEEQYQDEEEQYEDDEEQQEEEISFIDKYKLTPQKITKLFILLALLLALSWFIFISFQDFMFSAKKYSKVPDQIEMEEYSGLDQQVWRSYYYFKEMWQMSKDNVKNNKKFDLSLAMNKFGQITFNELFGMFKVLKSIQYAKNYSTSLQSQSNRQQFTKPFNEQDLIQAYNYTKYFNPAANQYQCASCYSFPIAATIEYIYKRYRNVTVKLSEQQLIDCSSQDDLVDGCKEGNITKGFQYARKVGLVSEEDYPYRSKGGHSYPCRKEIVNNPRIKKYKIDGYKILSKENCQAIQYQLSQGNAVASMIAIEPRQLSIFRAQEGKAYRNCPKEPFNHAITIVGQTQKPKQNWIIRNSWGISFGINGYFMIKGGNTCSICTHAIVPYFGKDK